MDSSNRDGGTRKRGGEPLSSESRNGGAAYVVGQGWLDC